MPVYGPSKGVHTAKRLVNFDAKLTSGIETIQAKKARKGFGAVTVFKTMNTKDIGKLINDEGM